MDDKTGRGLLVCPYWPSQPWYPVLLSLLIDPPILIPTGSIVDTACHLPRHCRLVAWTIGSSPVDQGEYLGQLHCVGSRELITEPLLHTRDVGPGSVIGIINGRQVTVASL